MTAITNELMYEVLKQLQAGQGDIKSDVRDVKSRLASIESYIATLHGDQARTGSRVDDIIARIERLEKRAGLVEA
jgi:phage shock protein A